MEVSREDTTGCLIILDQSTVINYIDWSGKDFGTLRREKKKGDEKEMSWESGEVWKGGGNVTEEEKDDGGKRSEVWEEKGRMEGKEFL